MSSGSPPWPAGRSREPSDSPENSRNALGPRGLDAGARADTSDQLSSGRPYDGLYGGADLQLITDGPQPPPEGPRAQFELAGRHIRGDPGRDLGQQPDIVIAQPWLVDATTSERGLLHSVLPYAWASTAGVQPGRCTGPGGCVHLLGAGTGRAVG